MRGSLTAPRLLTLLLFLLLVAISSFWALQILAPRPAIAPSASIGDTAAAPNLAPAVALFGSSSGATVAGPATDSNIQVSGVAEAGPEGVVILSVDGKPGAAYGVNDSVSEGTTVKSVGLDKVVLDQRGRLIELKTPVRASMDVLSSGVGRQRNPDDGNTVAPVSTRPAPPPVLPPRAPAVGQPQFQPPQPPQQQQMQQERPQVPGAAPVQ
jgi:general secretion pathway protein C